MRKGKVSLRRCLSQAAWAISMMKNNYSRRCIGALLLGGEPSARSWR